MGSLMEARRRILLSSPHSVTIQNADIAQFSTDMRSPLRALTVGIDPVQDLHGYDAPWPAGGGKNKWHLYANGYYNSNGGFSPSGANGCSEKIPVTVGATYVFGGAKATTETLTLRGYFFDENDAIVGSQIVGSSGSKSVSFTAPSGAVTVALWFSESGWTDTMTQTECDRLGMQMETGSSLTTYAPYSNLCPISGHTGANVWRTGRNLFDPTVVQVGTSSDITAALSGNKITLNGNNTATAYFNFSKFGLVRKQEAAIIIRTSGDFNGMVQLQRRDIYGNDTGGTTNITITSGTNSYVVENLMQYFPCDYFVGYIRISSGQTLEDSWIEFCLLLGGHASADDFVEYTGTTIPVTFTEAGTVYGGVWDVVNGVLRVDRAMASAKKADFSGKITGSVMDYRQAGTFSPTASLVDWSKARQQQISNMAKIANPNSEGGYGNYVAVVYTLAADTSAGNLRISEDLYQSMSDDDEIEVVYKLLNPLTYTLTPAQLDTLAGMNVVWGDSGKIELLKYWTH